VRERGLCLEVLLLGGKLAQRFVLPPFFVMLEGYGDGDGTAFHGCALHNRFNNKI
jgi:hypothetical protein